MRILNADSVELEETALIQKLKKDGKEALEEAGGINHVNVAESIRLDRQSNFSSLSGTN